MKSTSKIVALSIVTLMINCTPPMEKEVTNTQKFSENWESLQKATTRPDWFMDAKFGIYAHWGPVSGAFVGSEKGTYYDGWHGMMMYGDKGRPSWQSGEYVGDAEGNPKPTSNFTHHVKQFGDPAEFGYKYLIEQFNPSGFDAKEWAEVFASSGAKFAGPVAMHHDNFAMWDSKATRWNSMNYGGIDVSKELKREIEARGMKFMASFHHAFTWKFYAPAHDYGGIDPADYDLYTDPHTLDSNTPTDRFHEEWWAKLKEYIDEYQPDLIWFDWWLENLDEKHRTKFLAYYYNKGLEWNKEVAVTYKESIFPVETAIKDYERGRPNQPQDLGWLTDTSPGAWFYRPHTDFVESGELIDILVDIVSKNGCMLLNVPPDPDGTIPDEMKSLLAEMGDWLAINGEAIYGTRVWTIFGEGPTRLANGGHKVEEKGKITYTNTDIRFTKKSDTEIFAIVMDTPDKEVIIKTLSTGIGALNNDIEKVELLGSDELIAWERNEDGLIITPPGSFPTQHAHAFKITIKAYQEADIDGEI